VRYRDVSLFTRNKDGTKAVDFYLTIINIAQKAGVNPFEYISNLITGENNHKSLSEMIRWKSKKTTVDDRSEENYPVKANKQRGADVPVGLNKSTWSKVVNCSI